MGASRRQVLWSVILESALIGLAGAVVGLGLGIALAPGLDAIFKAFGANLADNGVVLETRTILVSLLVGLASYPWSPGRRPRCGPRGSASGRDAQRAPGRRQPGRRYYLATSIAVFVLGAAMVADGVAGGGGGSASRYRRPGAVRRYRAIQPEAHPRPGPGRGDSGQLAGGDGPIARENTRRLPGRTAITSAALMVGLALVTFVSVLAAGAKTTIDSAVNSSFAGNLIVEANANNSQGIPASLSVALQKVPGVNVVSPVSFSEADVKRRKGRATGHRGGTGRAVRAVPGEMGKGDHGSFASSGMTRPCSLSLSPNPTTSSSVNRSRS